jgi:hypothetical protein
MNRRIFKYELSKLRIRQFVSMPKSAEIVHVALQRDDLFVWAIVDEDADSVSVEFGITFTGDEPPPENFMHIGTCHTRGLVLHVFANAYECAGKMVVRDGQEG